MSRPASRQKLGFYPLVEAEAERIGRFLQFPAQCAVLDPCAGTGAALKTITASAPRLRRFGIELDSIRAAQAAVTLDEVVHGSVFDAHSPVESYSLVYLNPPYDDEITEDSSQRTEGVRDIRY
jgi:tRNA1(Val) A37 N6-methylase TrmN6